MILGTLALAFLAGVLSILSPCVLPLLPLVLGASASAHRAGPVALAAGVTLSFVALGLFVATIGFSIGLDGAFFRMVAALLMVAAGVVLITPALQARLAVAGSGFSTWANERSQGINDQGLGGQFLIGLLLGAVWSPCAGPTLGAASVLAAQGESLGQVAATMLVFGLGAALPLVVLGMLSRQTMARWRERLMGGSLNAKRGLGIVLVVLGVLILTGLDKRLEAGLVAASPAWLTTLTTRF